MGWWRPGPVPLTQLTNAPQEANTILASGHDLVAQPAAVLDMAERKVRLIRAILKIAVSSIAAVVPVVLEYWWGLRLAELETDGTLPALNPSVFLAAAADKREDWLWRGQSIIPVNTAAIFVVGLNDYGSPGLTCDFKPNRRLGYNNGLVLSYGHRFIGGGVPPATFFTDGTANLQLLVTV